MADLRLLQHLQLNAVVNNDDEESQLYSSEVQDNDKESQIYSFEILSCSYLQQDDDEESQL